MKNGNPNILRHNGNGSFLFKFSIKEAVMDAL